MLGCCFAVRLISNSQPIYHCGFLSSRVSRALSVFKITLAAHCYWLLLTVRQNFILINENKYPLIKLNYLVHVLCISKPTLWLYLLRAFWENGSGMMNINILALISVIQNSAFEEEKNITLSGHKLGQRMLVIFCLSNLEKPLCFTVLWAQVLDINLSNPCSPVLQPFATVFRIKLCMANAFQQK